MIDAIRRVLAALDIAFNQVEQRKWIHVASQTVWDYGYLYFDTKIKLVYQLLEIKPNYSVHSPCSARANTKLFTPFFFKGKDEIIIIIIIIYTFENHK